MISLNTQLREKYGIGEQCPQIQPVEMSDYERGYRAYMHHTMLNPIPVKQTQNSNREFWFTDIEKAKGTIWNYLKSEIAKTGANPRFTGNFKTVMQGLTLYFCGSPDSPYDLKKGLFIHGDTEVGKSTIFRALQQFSQLHESIKFDIVEVPELIADLKTNVGDPLTPTYYGIKCFDDIAINSPYVNDYGNEMNVLTDIIHRKYNQYIKSGKIAHFISNYPIDMLPMVNGGKGRAWFDQTSTRRLKNICTEIELEK